MLRVPKENRDGNRKIFEEIVVKSSSNLAKMINLQIQNSRNSKHKKNKENYTKAHYNQFAPKPVTKRKRILKAARKNTEEQK